MNLVQESTSIPDLKSLYYHRDFDGVVSAAMLLSLLETTPSLHPVDYHLKSYWASMRLDSPAAIVDFLFHPDATVWIDHHVQPFVLSEWADLALHHKFYIWDVNALSCPPVIEKAFHFSRKLRNHFASYIY